MKNFLRFHLSVRIGCRFPLSKFSVFTPAWKVTENHGPVGEANRTNLELLGTTFETDKKIKIERGLDKLAYNGFA